MEVLVRETGVNGHLVHDAHIAAGYLEHGMRELINGDRAFCRFAVRSAKLLLNPALLTGLLRP